MRGHARGDATPLAPGTPIGTYRIEAKIGAGAMGEVYRAQDTRLGRAVALKVLREDDALDPSRARRFEQEARAASALNHPAIVVVHDAGLAPLPDERGSVHYIAMELIDGEPLDALLRRGPLPPARCLELAAPLADGLARAHEAGIVHRDFKPSNVMVSARDRAKILDFGLAKVKAIGELAAGAATLTAEGTLLGTVGYMAPEQARGEATTAASDQFSFGCVLYEMLSGQRAFDRLSAAETLSAILRDEPLPLEECAPRTPPPLRWIVSRCLAKDPADRYTATRDLARELETLRQHASELSGPRLPAKPVPRWRNAARFAFAAALLLATGAWVALSLPSRPIAEPMFRPLTFRSGFVSRALFAPHSNAILYTASWDGQPLRTYQTLPETVGFDRSLDAEVQFPLAYSEDGSQVLVLLGVARSAMILRGTLAWWPALGGRPRPILEGVGWADWAPRAQMLAVVRDTGNERVLELRDANGALLRALFKTIGAITFVRFSPDEGRVAFGHHPSPYSPEGAVWTVALDGTPAGAITPAFKQCRGLDWNAATGEIWFTSSRNSMSNGLWATGPSGPLRLVIPLPHIFLLHDVSADGRRMLLEREKEQASLALRPADGPPRTLTWFGWSVVNDLSPDGRSVLFYDGGAGERTWGLWLRSVDGGDALRLGEGVMGRFSPDGRSVVTSVSEGSQPRQLVLMPVGAGERRRLTSPPAAHQWPSFAGPTTLLFVRSEGGRSEVWRMESDGSGARSLGAPDCDLPAASPSGDAFACVAGSDRRRLEIHSMDGVRRGSVYERAEGGRIRFLRWSARGDRLFAATADRRLLALDAATGRVRSDELLPYSGAGPYDSLIGFALTPDADLQAYSLTHYRSDMFEVSGFR